MKSEVGRRAFFIYLFHTVDRNGSHHLVSMNSLDIEDLVGTFEQFERLLQLEYSSTELVAKVPAESRWEGGQSVVSFSESSDCRLRLDQLSAQYHIRRLEFWNPDPSLGPWAQELSEVRKAKLAAANQLSAGRSPNDSARNAVSKEAHRADARRDSSLGDADHKFQAVSKAILEHVRLSCSTSTCPDFAPVANGFCWLRLRPLDMQSVLNPTTGVQVDISCALALFPSDGSVRIEMRADVSLRLLPRPGVSVSVAKIGDHPTYLLTHLSEPCNAMDSLRLLVDTEDDHRFVLVQFDGFRYSVAGWVTMQEAKQFAIDAKNRDGGRPPSFRFKDDPSPHHAN